eukprot:TRINITY_DN10790_c0_g1_i1.p1 TRINITY_DN10790_c0_g1~~TRINITY_DN10790_c0_g1_i1.p1  ORF type:complete len:1046 (-),score=232.83 TRINITY_DN10790_c0_g1_i1:205-3342(-)
MPPPVSGRATVPASRSMERMHRGRRQVRSLTGSESKGMLVAEAARAERAAAAAALAGGQSRVLGGSFVEAGGMVPTDSLAQSVSMGALPLQANNCGTHQHGSDGALQLPSWFVMPTFNATRRGSHSMSPLMVDRKVGGAATTATSAAGSPPMPRPGTPIMMDRALIFPGKTAIAVAAPPAAASGSSSPFVVTRGARSTSPPHPLPQHCHWQLSPGAGIQQLSASLPTVVVSSRRPSLSPTPMLPTSPSIAARPLSPTPINSPSTIPRPVVLSGAASPRIGGYLLPPSVPAVVQASPLSSARSSLHGNSIAASLASAWGGSTGFPSPMSSTRQVAYSGQGGLGLMASAVAKATSGGLLQIRAPRQCGGSGGADLLSASTGRMDSGAVTMASGASSAAPLKAAAVPDKEGEGGGCRASEAAEEPPLPLVSLSSEEAALPERSLPAVSLLSQRGEQLPGSADTARCREEGGSRQMPRELNGLAVGADPKVCCAAVQTPGSRVSTESTRCASETVAGIDELIGSRGKLLSSGPSSEEVDCHEDPRYHSALRQERDFLRRRCEDATRKLKAQDEEAQGLRSEMEQMLQMLREAEQDRDHFWRKCQSLTQRLAEAAEETARVSSRLKEKEQVERELRFEVESTRSRLPERSSSTTRCFTSSTPKMEERSAIVHEKGEPAGVTNSCQGGLSSKLSGSLRRPGMQEASSGRLGEAEVVVPAAGSSSPPAMAPARRPRVLITGATGMLGRQVLQAFPSNGFEVRALGFSRASSSSSGGSRSGVLRCDFLIPGSALRQVKEFQPDVVLHLAGEKRQEVLSKDTIRAEMLNISSTEELAAACEASGAWMLYMSSDRVFDGSKPPFSAQTWPVPLTEYGRQKLRGEHAVLQLLRDRGVVLRVPLMYGPVESASESAVTSLLPELLKEGVKKVDNWQQRYPTSAVDVSALIRVMVDLMLSDQALQGIYHWRGTSEPLTKYEMLQVVAQLASLDGSSVVPTTAAGGDQARAADIRLDCSRLEVIVERSRFQSAFREGLATCLAPLLKASGQKLQAVGKS